LELSEQGFVLLDQQHRSTVGFVKLQRIQYNIHKMLYDKRQKAIRWTTNI